ncbi:MAG: glutathione peroxidase [Flavitalea sp.]
MTGRQKIMRAIYPIITGMSRLFGKNNEVLKAQPKQTPPVSIYDQPLKLNNGTQLNLNELSGKKILFVNTASDCGYTGQYEELQRLQNKFAAKLVVIGFPANDFREQEKGSDEDIAQFCKINYGISFPLAAKTVVIKSGEQNAVFNWLTHKEKNGWNDKQPSWNFSKFLVDENGSLTHYFDPSVSPLGKEVTDAIAQ